MEITIERIRELSKKHFPFDTPNPGQLESIIWTVSEFMSGTKHIVLQAPTGIGKSAIATTIHKVIGELKTGHRTTIITATKGLQDQYKEMDPSIHDLKGKSNYPCPYDKGPYNSGACRAHVTRGLCNKHAVCPYVIQREKWCNKAKLRMSNTSFQIEACPAICMEPENAAQLMIIDECHDIDDAIVDHTTIAYIPQYYAFTIKEGFPQFKKGMEDFVVAMKPYSSQEFFEVPDDIIDASTALHELAEEILGYFHEVIKQSTSRARQEELGEYIESMEQISDKLNIFSNADSRGKWIISEWSNEKVEVKPVFAWQVANYALFRKADFFLHMSATICGIDEYASTLGLGEDFKYGEIPNPIPLENRPVYYIPKFKMNAQFNDFAALGRTIDALVLRHAPDNGIIHCVSFKLGNAIYQSLKVRDGAFITGDRSEIIQEMQNVKTGRVLISPSVEKGYDFKGDTSRFQIIPKVPYLYLGDPLIKLNSEYRSGWYARKAILRIVQACGRSIRGVDDHASTYIIDSSFGRLLSQNRDMFPSWFLDSIKIVKA